MDHKEEQIKEYLQRHGIGYIPIPPEHIMTVYNLFFRDIVNVVDDSTVLLYYYIYFGIKCDSNNAIKYCLMSAERGNVMAMNTVAYCYKEWNQDAVNPQGNPLWVKYYKMAIEHDNIPAMCHLAEYYDEQNDYENTVKYYTMAVAHEFDGAMNNLARYYEKCNEDENAVKYYLMAIECGNTTSMNNLACYHERQHDYVKAIEYYELAIQCGSVIAMSNLGHYYYKQNASANTHWHWWILAVEHGHYVSVDDILTICKRDGWNSYVLSFVNRLLNKSFGKQIADIVSHFINILNADMVNVIINMPLSSDDALFNKFKELV